MGERQEAWNMYEAAILLEAFLDFRSGDKPRSAYEKRASRDLRLLAKRQGNEIDDTFRNENGIHFQMMSMESAYLGYTVRKPATRLFSKITETYNTDRPSFERILAEAKAMIGTPKTNEQVFMEWVSSQIPDRKNQHLHEAFLEIERFCMRTKVLRAPLFDTVDLDTVAAVRKTVERNKIFTITHKKQMTVIRSAIYYYYLYIKDGHYQEFLDAGKIAESESEEANVELTNSVPEPMPTTPAEQTEQIVDKGPEAIAQSTESPINTAERTEKSESKNRERLFQKLLAVSKVYDDPAGLSLDRIMQLIGQDNDRNDVVTILDSFSWATKVGPDIYSFSKKPVFSVSPLPKSKSAFDREKCIEVLTSRYPGGMSFDSIDFENFRDIYNDMFDDALPADDEELRKDLESCGVIYQERLFPAEGIIDKATAEKLTAYIERMFSTGSKVLYYDAIMSDMADDFAYCFNLADKYMLREYMAFTSPKGKYYFHEEYMSSEKYVRIDHATEIAQYLQAAGKPLSYDELADGLPHLTIELIKKEISGHPSRFWRDAKEHYFHCDIFECSEDELRTISALISNEIDENGYALWQRVYERIQTQIPVFIENNLYLSSIGIRNALAVKLSRKYHFAGSIVSLRNNPLDTSEIFRLYAKHHSSFSDEEITAFAKEIEAAVNFNVLAEESVRVSRKLFVSKAEFHVDVSAADAAITAYIPGEYALIKDIDSFLLFPNVGYEWNSFLLESYLASYSKRFCVLNNGFSMNNVAGAVVKRGGRITEFVDVCAEALANSEVKLTKTAALDYLAAMNLITRRSYKDIETAIDQANRIRNRKG